MTRSEKAISGVRAKRSLISAGMRSGTCRARPMVRWHSSARSIRASGASEATVASGSAVAPPAPAWSQAASARPPIRATAAAGREGRRTAMGAPRWGRGGRAGCGSAALLGGAGAARGAMDMGSERQLAAPHRREDGLAPGVDLQLAVDGLDVVADGQRRDAQRPGGRLV